MGESEGVHVTSRLKVPRTCNHWIPYFHESDQHKFFPTFRCIVNHEVKIVGLRAICFNVPLQSGGHVTHCDSELQTNGLVINTVSYF